MTDAVRWNDASGYESYVGRWSRRVAERFLPWLEAPRGAAWVDVGCGTGVLTRAILELGDPESVVGVDPSEDFLALAHVATRDSRATYERGVAGDLPVEDGAAGVVVSGLVLNFVPDIAAALAEMRRAAQPEGLIAAYLWDYAGEMQLMRRFWDAATTLDPAAAELDEGRRFPIAAPGPLREAFEAAGLLDVEVEAIDVPTVFRDFDDYWTPFLSAVAPAPGYAMTLTPEARGRLRDRLDATLPRESDGSIALFARAWAVRGHR